ncbi:MAG: hypothetical protein JJU05_07600 [Verrucomicrobia bacterium]|nr:hypothetical protein [Verrucomicrobiota bacterium]MCH8527791.1 hypothetical protein [Kiritimatiellia bacterium]
MTTPQPLPLLEHRPLGRDAFLLKLQRPDWTWKAGQLVSLSGKNPNDQRDYTIASGENDETLDVIYRLIPHGILTPFLCGKKAGDTIDVLGPYGRFTLRDPSKNILFCSTGTGIAPCRAFLRSCSGLSLTLFHGVRYPEDLYFRDEFQHINYHPFCSREPLNGITRRLTDTLRTCGLPEDPDVYLCGANEMIYEAEEILTDRGVPAKRIFKEPYYYRAWD